MSKCALITGITGQDGHYLASHLTALGYSVVGHSRTQPTLQSEPLELSIRRISHGLQTRNDWLETIERFDVTEIYHLAGVTFIPESWDSPQKTFSANLDRTLSLLEALRVIPNPPKLFYAGSSEVFGNASESPLHEDSPFRPTNPYGISKAASINLVECYRSRFGIFACSGILFNHESPRRSVEFVSRKISQGAAAIHLGLQDCLTLGNLDVSRDWGFAADFVDCMHRMLAANSPSDFVIGTGKLTTLEQVVDIAFRRVGLNWKDWVRTDQRFVRPLESRVKVADSSKAHHELGWTANTTVEQLIEMMVDHDLELLERQSQRAA